MLSAVLHAFMVLGFCLPSKIYLLRRTANTKPGSESEKNNVLLSNYIYIYITAPALLFSFHLPLSCHRLLEHIASAADSQRHNQVGRDAFGSGGLEVEKRYHRSYSQQLRRSCFPSIYLSVVTGCWSILLLQLIPTHPITSIGLLDCVARTKHFWAHLLVVGQSISAKSLEKGLQQ